MKLLSGNLLKFAFFFAMGSIVFHFGLSWSISNHATFAIWLFAFLYFLFNAGIGWFFGKRDYESFPLNDVGFRFHFVSYVVFNVIRELWFIMGLHSQGERIRTVHLTALIWGIFLVIHFIFYLWNRKNSIRGLDKSEIFE